MKRTKLVSIGEDYVCASSISNYILNDALVDWLKMYKKTDKRSKITEYILEQGTSFEDKVIQSIMEKVPNESFVQVFKSENYKDYSPTDKILYETTLELMSKKTGIIYQGVLHGNESFKFYGCPDLIIRSDIFNKLFQESSESIEGYIIVDIKFCTLKLISKCKCIANSGRMPANKAQVIIYHKLLEISGHSSNGCYILGRNNKLGSIDPEGQDSWIVPKIEESYKWMIDLKKHGSKWTIDPPCRKELYPNMCLKYDLYHEKKEIAKKINEITLLWNVGIKQRELCHSKGIYKLDDPRLNTDIMKLPDTQRTKIIQKMIDFNQGKIFPGLDVIPEKVSKLGPWSTSNKIEFFIDFETFTNIFDSFESDLIFMVGLGYTVNNEWNYRNFLINEMTKSEELRIFKEMHDFIDNLMVDNDYIYDECNFYHWGNIEKNLYNRLVSEHGLRNIKFIDLNKIFQSEPILIRNVYDFSIKSVGKALIELKLIECDNWTDDISNGLDAMIESYELYKRSSSKSDFKDIIKYNEIDCKITYKLLDFLRKRA